MLVNSVVWIELVSLAASFDATHTSGLPLPQNIGEARKFVEVLDNIFKAFPACFGYDIPARPAATSRKSIMRKIVLWAQSCTPESAWQEWTAGMMAAFCPDPNGDLGHFNPHTSGLELLQTFSGVNPWMVSCWSCQFKHVRSAAHRRAFREPDARLWNLSRHMKARHSGVEPNMKSLATAFVTTK